MTTEPNKPCPFCGGTDIYICDGTSYRYVVASCVTCGAMAGEVRKKNLGEGPHEQWLEDAKRQALAEWDRRARET